MIYRVGNDYICIPLREAMPIDWMHRSAKDRAIAYAEEHGVCEFHISGESMIYYTSFPMERATYRATVNLITLKETREPLRAYYTAYKSHIGGKYTANYMA